MDIFTVFIGIIIKHIDYQIRTSIILTHDILGQLTGRMLQKLFQLIPEAARYMTRKKLVRFLIYFLKQLYP